MPKIHKTLPPPENAPAPGRNLRYQDDEHGISPHAKRLILPDRVEGMDEETAREMERAYGLPLHARDAKFSALNPRYFEEVENEIEGVFDPDAPSLIAPLDPSSPVGQTPSSVADEKGGQTRASVLPSQAGEGPEAGAEASRQLPTNGDKYPKKMPSRRRTGKFPKTK